MKYVIDSNNLAGQLGLLDDKDFDKKTIEIVKEYFFGKKVDVYLVFDGIDTMGDKFTDKNIVVIYSPKDSYYKSADDKVLELIKQISNNFFKSGKSKIQSIVLITDDIELTNRVTDFEKEKGIIIKKVKASQFADKINLKFHGNISSDNKELSKNEQDEITNELLKIWT